MVRRVAIYDVTREKAFFSGTDNGDDKNQITVSGVFGKLDKVPETVWRLNMQGQEIKLKLEDIFSTEDSPVEVPEDWLKKVSRNASLYGRDYGHLSGGSGHSGYSGSSHAGSGSGSSGWAGGKDYDRILVTALDKAYRPIPDEKIFSPKEHAVGSQSPNSTAVELSNLVGANREVEESAEEAVIEACILIHEAVGLLRDADMDLLEILQKKD